MGEGRSAVQSAALSDSARGALERLARRLSLTAALRLHPEAASSRASPLTINTAGRNR